MATHRARFLPLLLPGLATLAMGCGGYTSSYVPPPDGRPRLVWSDDKPVPMMSNPMPEACSEAVGSLAGGSGSVRVGGRVGGGGYVSGGYYIPGRTIVVVHGNALNAIADTYRRYLEGWFREKFKLQGTPLRIEFRSSTNPYATDD